MNIHEAYELMKDYGAFCEGNIYQQCQKGQIPCAKNDNGRWEVDNSYIERAIEWRKTVISVNDVIETNACYTMVPDEKRRVFCSHVKDRLRYLTCKHEYAKLFTGTFILNEKLDEARAIVDGALLPWRVKDGDLFTIDDIVSITGQTRWQIKQCLRSGKIQGLYYHDYWYIEKQEYQRISDARFNYIGIYDYVKNMKIKTIFDIDEPFCRLSLCNRLRQSDIAPYLTDSERLRMIADRRNALFFPAVYEPQIKEIVEPYIRNYGSVSKRIKLYASDVYWDLHPINASLVEDYCSGKRDPKRQVIMSLLVNTQLPEITECTEENIVELAEYVGSAKQKVYAKMAAQFISFAKSKYECNFRTDISFVAVTSGQYDSRAYSVDKYTQMGYMCFNDEFINELKLIDKALDSHKAAMLWLFCIWHYIAAWRKNDIFSIPSIELPLDPEMVVKKIKDGSYSNYASLVSAELEATINGRMMFPHKTEHKQRERALIVHIPNPASAIVGTVYSICCIHGGITEFKFGLEDYITFFGEDYVRIFGSEVFSNRKANKNCLDDLMSTTEKDSSSQEKVLGYAVASFARAHVTHGEMSWVTSRYL